MFDFMSSTAVVGRAGGFSTRAVKMNFLAACAGCLLQEIASMPIPVAFEPQFSSSLTTDESTVGLVTTTIAPTTVHQMAATCSRICANSLYYCVKNSNGSESCEMDTVMLAVVVVAALFTGIFLPLACISFYVCGIYSYLCNCFYSSKKSEDQSLLERRDFDTMPSMPSSESDKGPTAANGTNTGVVRGAFPIEKMYKKNPNRFSYPQVSWS